MGQRNLIAVTWTQPQHCCDCKGLAHGGYQELKYSEGGPYLEKRCAPCAEVHYADALPMLAMDIPKAPRGQSRPAAADTMTPAPLLGLAG